MKNRTALNYDCILGEDLLNLLKNFGFRIADYGLRTSSLEKDIILTINKILNHEQTSYTLYRSMGRHAI